MAQFNSFYGMTPNVGSGGGVTVEQLEYIDVIEVTDESVVSIEKEFASEYKELLLSTQHKDAVEHRQKLVSAGYVLIDLLDKDNQHIYNNNTMINVCSGIHGNASAIYNMMFATTDTFVYGTFEKSVLTGAQIQADVSKTLTFENTAGNPIKKIKIISANGYFVSGMKMYIYGIKA